MSLAVLQHRRKAFRSVAFNPADYGTPILWLDAASIGLADAATVTTWPKTTYGTDAAQATSAYRPTYKTNIINGKPVVRFPGTEQHMKGTISVTGTTLTAFGVITLQSGSPNNARILSMGLNNSVAEDYDNVAYAVPFIRNSSTQAINAYRNGAKSGVTVVYGTPAVISTVFNGTNCICYKNGSAGSSTASTGTFNISDYCVGANVLFTDGAFFVGDVAEILLYSGALATGNRSAVETALGAKYGLF